MRKRALEEKETPLLRFIFVSRVPTMASTEQNATTTKAQDTKCLEVTNDCLLSFLNRSIKESTRSSNYGTPSDCLTKLRKALDKNDKKEIKKIIRMPATYARKVVPSLNKSHVKQFIDVLDDIAVENPRKGIEGASWIHSLLYVHGNYLDSLPDLKVKLMNLQRLVSTHSVIYMQLQKIAGRVELLTRLSNTDYQDESNVDVTGMGESDEVVESAVMSEDE